MSKDCNKTKTKFRKHKSFLYHGNWASFYDKKRKRSLERHIRILNDSVNDTNDRIVELQQITASLIDFLDFLEPYSDKQFAIVLTQQINEVLVPVQQELVEQWTEDAKNFQSTADSEIPGLNNHLKQVSKTIEAWLDEKKKHIEKIEKIRPRLC